MADAVETIKAWQCVWCRRVEASAPCVGICRDEPVDLVNADTYRAAVAKRTSAVPAPGLPRGPL